MLHPTPVLAVSAALMAMAIAAPAPAAEPQFFGVGADETFYCPVVDSAVSEIHGDWQVGISIPGGGQLQVSETHEVGTEWSVGADLGISAGDVLGAAGSFSFSVSETVSDSVSETDSLTCPDGAWHCSLVIHPAKVHVKGRMVNMEGKGCPTAQVGSYEIKSYDFEYWIPQKDSAGNGVWTPELCTCHNNLAWADDGHPPLQCPNDCAPQPA